MHLVGSIAEIRGILQTAADLKADAIHFLAPNAVFILAQNKQDYVYVETDLLIGQSVLVPRTTYQNMKMYIRGAIVGVKFHESMFYDEKIETILFTSTGIYFNESERLKVEVDLINAPLKKDVEFRVRETMQTSAFDKLPLLRLPLSSFQFIKSEMAKYKKQFYGRRKKSSDNAIRIEDGQLVLYYHVDGERVRIETGLTDFFANDESKTYSFSDRGMYLFLWLVRSTVCDEVAILPRDSMNYGIVEGHTMDMVVKVRTMLKNDILDKIV